MSRRKQENFAGRETVEIVLLQTAAIEVHSYVKGLGILMEEGQRDYKSQR